MLLRANKAKYKYKNEKAWLDAVYRKNKVLIDSALSEVRETNKKKIFIQLIKERKETRGETLYQAVRRIGKTDVFSSKKERAQENILNAIKREKDIFKTFRKSVGWKKKIDTTKFRWDYDDGVYKYENVVIDVSNSPHEINIYTTDEWEKINK